jgi:predicted acylesterase/phospholipase RssA
VLSAGASWAAYQIGALRHLVVDRRFQFALCMGSGIGAMNAAFVACDAYEALEAFWREIGWRKLVAFNWRTPWRAIAHAGPQLRFIERYVSEERLAASNARLVFNALDLRSGQLKQFRYPGESVPLVEAIAGAVALPGLSAPRDDGLAQWVEATVARGFALTESLSEDADEIYAVGAAPTAPGRRATVHFGTWRAVAIRALALNQSNDIWRALTVARERIAVMSAHETARNAHDRVCARVTDSGQQARLRAALAVARQGGERGGETRRPPRLVAIAPSRDLGYPLYHFGKRALGEAIALGEADARAAVASA